MGFIYFCSECNSFDVFDEKKAHHNCPSCGKPYLPLCTTLEDWNRLSNEEMLEAIKAAQKPQIKSPFNEENSKSKKSLNVLEDDTPVDESKEGENSKSKLTIILVIVLAILTLLTVVVVFLVFRSDDLDDDSNSAETAIESTNDSAKQTVESTPSAESSETKEEMTETPTESKEPVKRENTDFRNTCWGDSLETVKESEDGSPVDELSDSLMYEGTLSGHDVYILYYFKDGKLVHADYALKESFTNGGQYISLYEQWKETLIKQYGKVDSNSPGLVKYVDDGLIETAGPARALEYGYTAYADDWYTNNTHIRIGLVSNDYEMSLLISYYDKKYNPDDEDLGDF